MHNRGTILDGKLDCLKMECFLDVSTWFEIDTSKKDVTFLVTSIFHQKSSPLQKKYYDFVCFYKYLKCLSSVLDSN